MKTNWRFDVVLAWRWVIITVCLTPFHYPAPLQIHIRHDGSGEVSDHKVWRRVKGRDFQILSLLPVFPAKWRLRRTVIGEWTLGRTPQCRDWKIRNTAVGKLIFWRNYSFPEALNLFCIRKLWRNRRQWARLYCIKRKSLSTFRRTSKTYTT